MNEYEFVLRFQLPKDSEQPEQYLDSLYEAGCDDAIVGIGLPGYIGLDFCREANSAEHAVTSAINDVKKAIPDSKLTEVTPDLLNISEITKLVNSKLQKISRQAMRKYAFGQVAKMKSRFPAASVTSSSPLWHADEVIDWLVVNCKTDREKALKLIETSKVARAYNFKLQAQAIREFSWVPQQIDL